MTKVAVYGSLRMGFGNHRRLEGATYLGTTTTTEPFSMYSLGGFPKVNLKVAVCPIVVEVYECDADVLRSLDYLEGYRGPNHDNFYDRSEVETGLGAALIYHIDSDADIGNLVKNGDWADYCDKRQKRY